MEQRKLILASQSPQRRLLLSALGVDFEVVPAHIDEKQIRDEVLSDRAKAIARAKAQKVAQQHPQAVILAADSFVVCEGEVLEKPETLDEAKIMLHSQSSKWIEEYSGVCFIDPSENKVVSELGLTRAQFRHLSDAEIERYMADNPVLTWSGAFSPAYPAGANLFARVEGSLTGFTHGFPMEIVAEFLKQSGFLQ